MMKICNEIDHLIRYGMKNALIGKYDKIAVRNAIMSMLNISDWSADNDDPFIIPEFPQKILDNICKYAIDKNIIEDSTAVKDLFDTKIMGALTPRAGEVIKKFYDTQEKSGIMAATDDYYLFSQKTNYIRTNRIAKNLYWTSHTEYGNMEITVNLSKPEKDPKDIAKAKNAPQMSYPKCLLCYENVGYQGRIDHPARQNHRVIPLNITDKNTEEWFLQYSPYVYYNEHAIVFCSIHRPMKIDKDAFDRITRFVHLFPHYFLGSNADLPIVGGSILTHDHYQGGHHTFPMAKANIETQITFQGYDNVKAGIVKWPMSVIRIKSSNREKLVDLADKILRCWREYSDEALEIKAFSNETPHNTITPIARMSGSEFEMDLVLRNNRTTDEYPLGIFHPHQEVYNIKKENIGLIEVMGLAVLPGRLKEEMEILSEYMLDKDRENKIANDEKVNKHLYWSKKIYEKYQTAGKKLDKNNIGTILKEEIGITFSTVLEYAGVYKRDESGNKGFLKFIEYVNKK